VLSEGEIGELSCGSASLRLCVELDLPDLGLTGRGRPVTAGGQIYDWRQYFLVALWLLTFSNPHTETVNRNLNRLCQTHGPEKVILTHEKKLLNAFVPR